MARGKTPISVPAITSPDETEFNGDELEVISLYQTYKSKRIPNRYLLARYARITMGAPGNPIFPGAGKR